MKSKLSSLNIVLGANAGAGRLQGWLAALPTSRWMVRRIFALLLCIVLLGSSGIPSQVARVRSFAMAVAGHTWDLIGWEIDALSEKVTAYFRDPADAVAENAKPAVVVEYLERAARIGAIEGELARRAVLPVDEGAVPTNEELTTELGELRALQTAIRPAVEQIIEQQTATVLADYGFLGWGEGVWPPVSFTFVEPPKKLVISRRDRIETIYSQMLEAEINIGEIEEAEAEIRQQYNAVGYITDIGGLGAFPTMVVDRASLRWVLSTVAHEWAHNYLVFHPLGWNYFKNQDLTTINETVAEIIGNEIGDITLARYYPEMVPPPQPVEPPISPEPQPFEFQIEMRETRLEVDRLLAAGEVAEAEAYMAARRQLFVENGFPLRVLNQAYFAFHGSYGTSPASTSPIGPDLDRLRLLMPDLESFLITVRGFTSVEDLQSALAMWEATVE